MSFVGKLDYRDEVAYTETEAHHDLKRSSAITVQERRLENGRRWSYPNHVGCIPLAELFGPEWVTVHPTN
jgi:hypothetical protein